LKPTLLKNTAYQSERALLVGTRHPGQTRWEAADSLEELQNLAYSAGASVVAILTQEVRHIDPAYFIGRGKVEELKLKIQEAECHVVIFDEDLSPSQNRNLEKILNIKVIDRTGLILDIFSQRARTKEGKLQVELAQSLYLLPRLVGQWGHFSRQTGGIGTRGPGETQLEVDRRRIREKVTRIRHELERVESAREIHRNKRQIIPIPTVSLVGYTNAGKSTLMRALTQANVLVEDKLFATLDPTVRRLKLPSGREILMADTVGFIRKLPHTLVESFKATFEEIRGSDLLIHVIDASHPTQEEQVRMVEKVLTELDLSDKPVLEVYNKIDLLGENYPEDGDKIYISASKKRNLESLLHALDETLSKDFKKLKLEIPHTEGSLLAFLHRYGRVLSKTYNGEGIGLEVEVYEKYLSQLRPYRVRGKR
jgi:GTP-binding protein HflX